jgi:hypothetical protein
VSAPGDQGVEADYRDFPPLWHAKAIAVSSVILAVCLALAWKLFL